MSLPFTDKRKGQSICIALGTLASCKWPVCVDLTDGAVHHLLSLKGGKLVGWLGLSPTKAYHKLAQELNADPHLMTLDVDIDQGGDEEEKSPGGEERRARKRLRTGIRPVSVLQEQLDSVLPFLSGQEKLQAAFEIISSHVAAVDDGKETMDVGYLGMFA